MELLPEYRDIVKQEERKILMENLIFGEGLDEIFDKDLSELEVRVNLSKYLRRKNIFVGINSQLDFVDALISLDIIETRDSGKYGPCFDYRIKFKKMSETDCLADYLLRKGRLGKIFEEEHLPYDLIYEKVSNLLKFENRGKIDLERCLKDALNMLIDCECIEMDTNFSYYIPK